MGGAAPAGGEPAEGEVPVQEGVPGENGEVPPEGGAMGFAKGLLGKAMAVKDGAMAKAGDLGAGIIGVSFRFANIREISRVTTEKIALVYP